MIRFPSDRTAVPARTEHRPPPSGEDTRAVPVTSAGDAGCLASVLGYFGHRPPADNAAFDGAPRLQLALYRAEHGQLHALGERVVADPSFVVLWTGNDHRCALHLEHHDAREDPRSYLPHIKLIDGHYFRFDASLNGHAVRRFNPALVLQQRLAQTLLALTDLGPLADTAIWWSSPWNDRDGRRQPHAITVSQALPGTAIDHFHGGAEVRALWRDPASAAALSAAWVLQLGDVFRPDGSAVHHLVRDPAGRLRITGGSDDRAGEIPAGKLTEKRIHRIFGMDRAAVLQALEFAAEAARDFAGRHAEALAHVDASMAGRRDATAPLAVLEDYLEACRTRLRQLKD